MSWPEAVVPSQCAADGPRLRPYADACGLSGAMTPGITAKIAKMSRMIPPASALRFDLTARQIRPPARWVAPAASRW